MTTLHIIMSFTKRIYTNNKTFWNVFDPEIFFEDDIYIVTLIYNKMSSTLIGNSTHASRYVVGRWQHIG